MKRLWGLVLTLFVTASIGAKPFPGEERVSRLEGSLTATGLWLEMVQFYPGTSSKDARSNLAHLFNHLHQRQYCLTVATDPSQSAVGWVALQKKNQMQPRIEEVVIGDDTFWGQALQNLRLGTARIPYAGRVERRNFPSDYLEVWGTRLDNQGLSVQEEQLRLATVVRLNYWDEPVRAVVVHLQNRQGEPVGSACWSSTGNLERDLMARPTDGAWRLGPARPQPRPR